MVIYSSPDTIDSDRIPCSEVREISVLVDDVVCKHGQSLRAHMGSLGLKVIEQSKQFNCKF